MEIYKNNRVSRNETYCCMPKELKSVLGDCDISVAFEHGNRKFVYKNYKKITLAGIAAAEFNAYKTNDYLRFYITIFSILKTDLSEEIEKEFNEVILPKMLAKYNEYSKGNENISNLDYNMTVQIKDGRLSVQENVKKA